jgi:hypothetical protein
LSLATDKQFGLPVVPDKIGTVRKA